MEKREPLCAVGGNINWFSRYGKQYGGSFKKLKIKFPGFPGGAVAESLPADAGDTGSIPGPDPWSGKIPHATEQMGP